MELPSSVIAGLYKDLLVVTAEPQPAPVKKENNKEPGEVLSPDKWIVLGENRKQILVVVQHSNAMHLPDRELAFLTKILGSCKLDLGDAAIVNMNNYPASPFKELTAHFNSKIVFLFGVEPAHFGMPINFPHFQVQSFRQATYLFSPTLSELELNNLLKSKCWVCLKRIFNL